MTKWKLIIVGSCGILFADLINLTIWGDDMFYMGIRYIIFYGIGILIYDHILRKEGRLRW